MDALCKCTLSLLRSLGIDVPPDVTDDGLKDYLDGILGQMRVRSAGGGGKGGGGALGGEWFTRCVMCGSGVVRRWAL